MLDLKLDASGDLAIEGGDARIVSGVDEIAQSLRIRLRLFKGEWFLNNELGTDYYGRILLKNPDLAVVAAELQAVILGTVGVTRLTEYSQAFNTAARGLAVTFTVETESGDLLTVSEVIGS